MVFQVHSVGARDTSSVLYSFPFYPHLVVRLQVFSHSIASIKYLNNQIPRNETVFKLLLKCLSPWETILKILFQNICITFFFSFKNVVFLILVQYQLYMALFSRLGRQKTEAFS